LEADFLEDFFAVCRLGAAKVPLKDATRRRQWLTANRQTRPATGQVIPSPAPGFLIIHCLVAGRQTFRSFCRRAFRFPSKSCHPIR
jgi:hypothetical protein